MNHSPQDMYYASQMPGGQNQTSQTVTSDGISHFTPQQQPPLLQPGPAQYPTTNANYNHYASYTNVLTSPHSAAQSVPGALCQQGNVLPLPSNLSATQTGIPGPNYGSPQSFDMSGQYAPPGAKPRVTATLWEDEGSLCFQVEAKGVCVARREDNHMINGTKLLNVAGMTRGRRDGILKGEKNKKVVKIGPMHLKGVWIPFDRALDFANKEKITEILYPLFVHDISHLMYHPHNQIRANAVMAAVERRRHDANQFRNTPNGLPSLHQHHHPINSSVDNVSNSASNTISPHSNIRRSGIDRPQSFPTPPNSASNVINNIGTPEGSFQWSPQTGMQNVQNSTSLPIDSGLTNGRTMPATPASTPPGSHIQSIQYQQGNQAYDSSRQIYSSSHQNSYSQSSPENTNIARYQASSSYMKNDMSTQTNGSQVKSEMGPPTVHGARQVPEGHDKDQNVLINSQHQAQQTHDEERDNENDSEYTHGTSTAFDSARAPYNYSNSGSVGSLPNDHSQVVTDITGSPNNPTSGRATPRTATGSQPYYPHSTSYTALPRAQASSSNLYSTTNTKRGTQNGNIGDVYSASAEGSSISGGYATQQQPLGVNGAGTKRSRDETDIKPSSSGSNGDIDSGKRRNTGSTSGVKNHDISATNRPRPPILQRRC